MNKPWYRHDKKDKYPLLLPDRPPRAGKRWYVDEDKRLIKGFEDNLDWLQLAMAHDRSPLGIVSRLKQLGRLRYEKHSNAYYKTDYSGKLLKQISARRARLYPEIYDEFASPR